MFSISRCWKRLWLLQRIAFEGYDLTGLPRPRIDIMAAETGERTDFAYGAQGSAPRSIGRGCE